MPNTPEQAWLHRLVGSWTYTGQGMMGEGKPNFTFNGTQDIRAVGDAWILGETRGTMPDGSPTLAFLSVGHDPESGGITGTWIGSMMAYMWHYTGTLENDKLTLATRGPNMAPGHAGTMADYEERITITGPDTWRFASAMKKDGQWVEFMWMDHERAR